MKKTLSKKGFTLIELMVVIAIIALLTGIITVNLTKSRGKARDAKRVSDVAQIQLALELVFDRCNMYPAGTSMGTTDFRINPAIVCRKNGLDISIGTFISTIPAQQSAGTGDTTYYRYIANAAQTDYVLATRLENPSEVLADDYDLSAFDYQATYFSCDDGNYLNLIYNYCVKPQ